MSHIKNGFHVREKKYEKMITHEMEAFMKQYLLQYKDIADARITKMLQEKFQIAKEKAREIEKNYVIYNRNRIYNFIERKLNKHENKETIIEQLREIWGIDRINAKKYILRCELDQLDEIMCFSPELAEEVMVMTPVKKGEGKP